MPISGPTNGVICKRCKRPIRLDHTDRLAEEFSLACPHCGHRAFYRDKEIKPLDGRSDRAWVRPAPPLRIMDA